MKSSQTKGRSGCIFILVSFSLLILLISSVSKQSSEFISDWLKDIDTTNVALSLFESQNHYFQTNDENNYSLISLGTQLISSIDFNDPNSFLRQEIPGYRFFDTKIHIAGEGTNFSNIPYESTPPLEVLLKERVVAEELLKEIQEENIEKNWETIEKKLEDEVVFIYQSHSWESFLPLLKDDGLNPDEATSNNPKANVIALGEILQSELKSKGIRAKHDTTNMTDALLGRGWNYNQSYILSRETILEVLGQSNSIRYFVDIHRDSARRDITTIDIKNKSYARLFFVVGEGHKNFQANLEIAELLHFALEKKYPGLSRGVFTKDSTQGNGKYNQDLSNRSILLEVGGVDNNLEELQNGIHAFSDVFSNFIWEEKGAGEF